jgi:hypothetical protein
MAAFTSLVLKDHAAADHTFSPRDLTGGVATTVNSAGVPIGEKTASFAITKTTTGRRKMTLKLVLPIVQDVVVAGISKPTVVRSAYADLTVTVDATSSTAERQDLLAYLISFISETGQIKPMIEDLSAPF